MKWLFWVSLFGFLYSYLIYPMILLALPKRKRSIQPVTADAQPPITLIIAAHNEEGRIRDKLEDSLRLGYPKEKLQILVASDCSTDTTDEIVREYADRGITLVRADEHYGKEYAQSLAIAKATGDIVVFSDTATKMPQDSLRELARLFADPEIGAVSSEDRFISRDGSVVGEGAYVRYEMWLRRLEGSHAGLVGLSGSFFAARKEVCEPWDTRSPSDFNTALNCAVAGKVAISSDKILGYYKDISDPAREYHRKVRTVVRGITAIARRPAVLNPFHFGFFAFQVWSHKIMRWAVPWFMLLLFVSNFALATQSLFYAVLFAGQLAAYALAALALVLPELKENALIRLAFFFCQVNLAIADATQKFLRGQRITTWTPSKR